MRILSAHFDYRTNTTQYVVEATAASELGETPHTGTVDVPNASGHPLAAAREGVRAEAARRIAVASALASGLPAPVELTQDLGSEATTAEIDAGTFNAAKQ